MWDLPGPGLEPVSPALSGGFLTTAPPGKSQGTQSYLKERNRKNATSFFLPIKLAEVKNWQASGERGTLMHVANKHIHWYCIHGECIYFLQLL